MQEQREIDAGSSSCSKILRYAINFGSSIRASASELVDLTAYVRRPYNDAEIHVHEAGQLAEFGNVSPQKIHPMHHSKDTADFTFAR
jgi:hypothetical protein